MSEPRDQPQAAPGAPQYAPPPYPYAQPPTYSPLYPPPPAFDAQSGYPPPPNYAYPMLDERGVPQGMPPSFLTSRWATWSLICSVTSLFTSGITAILGVIFGHMALREIRRYPWVKGKGLAIAGLVIGYFFLAFYVFIIVAVIVSIAGHSGSFPV